MTDHPVMILRPAVAPVTGVVVGVNGSAGAMAALDWAAAEALRCQTGLRIVSAWEEKPARAGLPADGQSAQAAARIVQEALSRVLSRQCYPRRIACAALKGSPGCALLSRAGSTELLVLGATGDGVVQVPGATSRHCLRHSHNPLVLVPARRPRGRPLPQGAR